MCGADVEVLWRWWRSAAAAREKLIVWNADWIRIVGTRLVLGKSNAGSIVQAW